MKKTIRIVGDLKHLDKSPRKEEAHIDTVEEVKEIIRRVPERIPVNDYKIDVKNTVYYKDWFGLEVGVTGNGYELLYSELKTNYRLIAERGFEWTQTFTQPMVDRFESATLTEMLRTAFKKLKAKFPDFCIILIGEFSPIPAARYHMHGVAVCEARSLDAIKRKIKKEFGGANTKTIHNVESWVRYSFKKDEANIEGQFKPIIGQELIYLI